MTQIIRGTTPTIEFTYSDIAVSDITTAYLVIRQSGLSVIEKPISDATIGETSLSWELTQEETLQLNGARNAQIVCDWVLASGVRGRSNILTVDVGEPGKNEVI